ncbi:unnamed protein product [Penicillium glandicola]
MNGKSKESGEAFATACEYTISKGLLCAESPVFTAMFKCRFCEAQQQTVDLEEMEGVITTRSLEALFQWLYLRFIKFDIEDPGEHISAATELARLADKYEITGIESQIARYIKKIILANPDTDNNEDLDMVDNNTLWLGTKDIISGTLLPNGHPVRRLLAKASVGGYLQSAKHQFSSLAQEHPRFGADLLHEVRLALDNLNPPSSATFEDPLTGKIRTLERDPVP